MKYEGSSFPFGKLVLIGLIVLIGVAVWKGFFREKNISTQNFHFVTNQSTSKASFEGKVTVLNFWSTSCVPCIQEMPVFSQMHRKYESRGLQIIAVALPMDDSRQVANLAVKGKWPFKVAYDADGSLTREWGKNSPIHAIPRTFIINRQGRVVDDFTGSVTATQLDGMIRKLL